MAEEEDVLGKLISVVLERGVYRSEFSKRKGRCVGVEGMMLRV